MQTAKTSGLFENSVFEIHQLGKIHALLQDVLYKSREMIAFWEKTYVIVYWCFVVPW